MTLDLRKVKFSLYLLQKCFENDVDLSEYFMPLQYDGREEMRKCRELRREVSDLLQRGVEVV